MKMQELVGSLLPENSPASPEDIQILQQVLLSASGRMLPDDYCAFLALCGGGVPVNSIWVRGFDVGYIGTVFGIGTLSRRLVNGYRLPALREPIELPIKLFSVATNCFGDSFCLSLDQHRYGSVYHLNNEDDLCLDLWPDNLVEFDQKSLIASTFEDFVSLLHTEN
jgi:hypothetical protein